MVPLAEGVWVEQEPIRFLGMRFQATMTVLRLRDGALLLHSPVRLTAERRAAVEKLGRVAHLYAPNHMHHLWMGSWAEAFPSARVHAPEKLKKKRRDLRIDRVNASGPEPDFDGVVDEVRIDGFRLEETVLFHRPSKTLVATDLVQNIGRPTHWWTKAYSKMMGFYDRVALSRAIAGSAFPDKRAARRSVDAVLALPFERMVVAHNGPVTDGAREALAAAYGWLKAA
jgi:hypothetical protein